jgi:ectoine hydroxylase-related dioxygenase (phytanoyl-CoA dioxygenase family)
MESKPKPFNTSPINGRISQKRQGDLFPPETRRCPNLCGRSKTAREVWLVDDLIRTLTAKFIDKTTSNYYGETKHTYTSEAICQIALTMEIGPGGKAQRLHRDDKNWHADHVDQTKTGYRFGSDVMMGFMIPGIRTTRASAGTLAIPGSHLWGDDRPPKTLEITCIEMEVGDCSIHLGSTYHAGGENTTTDVQRTMHSIFFSRGWFRQEENIYLCNSQDEVLSWSDEAQKRLGYCLSSPNIGFVEFRHPIAFLRGETEGDFGDFDESQEKNGEKKDSVMGTP